MEKAIVFEAMLESIARCPSEECNLLKRRSGPGLAAALMLSSSRYFIVPVSSQLPWERQCVSK